MRYSDAVRSLEQLVSFQGIKPGLARIQKLLHLLNDPQSNFQTIHIAGTNGKGTVTRMLATAFADCGYVTGEYTSPHLISYRERFCINGVEISEAEFTELFVHVSTLAKSIPDITEFELLTAMAFEYFSRKDVSVVMLETGLGGRFDATNVVMPLVSIITSISYDHQVILGNTLKEIAYEKGGIIKPAVPVIIGKLPAEAKKEIQHIARKHNSKVIVATPVKLKTSMIGEQQSINCGIVLAVRRLLNTILSLPEKKYKAGISRSFLQGRLQVIKRPQRPLMLLDGAHNEEAARQLARNLKKYYPNKKKTCVVGILKRKDAGVVLRHVLSVADTIIVTAPTHEYHSVEMLGKTIEDLRAHSRETGNKKRETSVEVKLQPLLKDAVALAERLTDKHGLICIAGSFYLVGEYLKRNKKHETRNNLE